jgi:energy-converting hydrogenase Eha subunit E
MKISPLVLVSVAIAVVGCGFSFVGYNQSTQIITFTNTQSFTTSSLFTITSLSTAPTSTIISSSSMAVYDNILINAADSDSCYYNGAIHSLDAGQAQISFLASGGQVHFWMFTESQFSQFKRTFLCIRTGELPSLLESDSLVGQPTSGSVQVPTAGFYYFVFLNWNNRPVSISLTVIQNISTRGLAVNPVVGLYTTGTTTVPTQKVSTIVAPAGLGQLFYLGLASIGVVIIILVYDRSQRHKEKTSG